MIEYSLDSTNSILHVRLQGSLEKADFEQLAAAVDPHITQTGGLAGLVIKAPAFPGWENLGALAAHVRFVREHHRQIRRIAVSTDSALGKVAEQLASHFVAAEIRRFPAVDLEAARHWAMGGA